MSMNSVAFQPSRSEQVAVNFNIDIIVRKEVHNFLIMTFNNIILKIRWRRCMAIVRWFFHDADCLKMAISHLGFKNRYGLCAFVLGSCLV